MKNFKRITALVLALVMVFAFAGCARKVNKQVAPQGQNLTFEAVEGWKEQTQTNAMASYTNGTASIIVTWVEAPTNNLDSYINDKWKEKRITETKDFNIIDEGTYTLGGTEFKTLTYTGTMLENINMKYTFFFAIINGHLYEVSVGDLADRFDSRGEEYYAFLDTAKFN